MDKILNWLLSFDRLSHCIIKRIHNLFHNSTCSIYDWPRSFQNVRNTRNNKRNLWCFILFAKINFRRCLTKLFAPAQIAKENLFKKLIFPGIVIICSTFSWHWISIVPLNWNVAPFCFNRDVKVIEILRVALCIYILFNNASQILSIELKCGHGETISYFAKYCFTNLAVIRYYFAEE